MCTKITITRAMQLFSAVLFLSLIPLNSLWASENQGVIDNDELEVMQTRTVSGKVTSMLDDTGMPGVNVIIKGTQTGTITDVSGNYSLDISGDNVVLVFSYIGFRQEEISVGTRSVINVSLAESIEALQEVVVTALGIEREKRSLGYSVGEVDGRDLGIVGQENVVAGLAARVPGVTINQTSGAGSSVSVVIRGITSLTTDNQPLFVVDGVPMSNSLNNMQTMGDRNQVDYGNAISDLNPDDIETMTVLKGPSAAALYGSRAGNGVILITTKQGKRGQGMQVNVSSNTVFEYPVKFLDFHYKYASGNRTTIIDERSSYWTGLPLDQGNLAPQWNSPLDENGNRIPTELRSYPDNMRNFLQTGITSTNTIGLTGSTDKATYRFSYTNMTNQGMVPNSDLYRNNISANTTYDISNKLKLSTSINWARTHSNDRPATGNRGANPLEAVYNYPHVDVRELRDYWMPGQEQIMQRNVEDNQDNPYFLAYGVTNAFMRDRIFGNVRLDYQINENWSAFARVMHDSYNEKRETKMPWSYTRENRGGYFLEDLQRQENNIDFLITYDKKLSQDFSLNVSGGSNFMIQRFENHFTGTDRNAGLIVPGLYRLDNIPRSGLLANNWYQQRSIFSVYGMASLGFKDQLYLDLTARNDWSSALPPDNRSYFYPSASLSWLANYTFNLPQNISMLKFRAGWAQVGNDTDPYRLSPVMTTGNWGNLITTGIPGTLLNPNLKPEIATSTELGLDFSMYENRLRFEGTYFYMENANQILSVQTPTSSGFGQKLINAGLLTSQGWEVMFGGTPLRNQNGWNWDVNVNFTRFRTRVAELADGIDFITLWEDNNGGAQTYVGDQIGDLYSRGFAHVEDPNSEYYRWPILDQNGKWIPNNDRDARVRVGNFNPDFMMGMQTTLNYKRWTLGASFDLRMGGDFMSFTYRYGESNWKSQRQIDNLIPGMPDNPEAMAALLRSDPDRYIIPQNGNFPRVGGYTQETGGYWNDNFGSPIEAYDGVFIPGVQIGPEGEYIEHLGGDNTVIFPASRQFAWNYNQQITFDASFLKLRELSLGYDIPNFGGFRNANFSVYTRNVLLWTAAGIGIDPERAFQFQGGRQGDSANLFRQGIELQNVMPWTIPVGFRINFTL